MTRPAATNRRTGREALFTVTPDPLETRSELMRTQILSIVGLAWIVVAAAGCDQGPSLYPVRGHLIIGGQLAGNASIALHWRSKGGQPVAPGGIPYLPVAVTGPDGSFSVMTLRQNDGAPPGEYAVTLHWPDASVPFDECECPDPKLHDRLRGLYSDPTTSPLTVKIVPKENVLNLVAMEAHSFGPGSFPGAGGRGGVAIGVAPARAGASNAGAASGTP